MNPWIVRRRLIFILAATLILGSVAITLWAARDWPRVPHVSFQSSDGNWADNEVLAKGRDFDAMVFGFELYKIQCDANDADLIRTTRQNPLNLEARDNYRADAKWKVPYGMADKSIGTYYPPVGLDHCANHPVRQETLDLARENTNSYIASLKDERGHRSGF